MASSREVIHEEGIAPLIGAGQGAPEAVEPLAAAPMERAARNPVEGYEEKYRRIMLVSPVPSPWWWRLPFLGPGPNSFPVGQPLDLDQIEMLYKSRKPGHFKRLAMGRELAMVCLEEYNALHPNNKYEPAPGKVTKTFHFDNGTCWTHGNFVARRKRSGCLSFLPGPRKLFFFEVKYSKGSTAVTCTPLDEPVTEAYSVLGFPLWWSKRRSGKFDTICMTCSCRFYLPHPRIRETSPCGHDNIHGVCEMCYKRSIVLHPDVFEFGCPGPRQPNRTLRR